MVAPAFMIVEDGTARVDSNAYWDLDSITAYLTNKGVLDWENYTANEQARATISATMYIEKRFRNRFRGLRQQVEQALGWPRIGAFDNDSYLLTGVPFQVRWACAEYAIRAARLGVLAPDPIRSVPTQDLSISQPGLTAGTATFTPSANLADGDVLAIGTRKYTMQTVLTLTDGHVLLGGTVAETLLNIANAINDNGGGTPDTDYHVTQSDPNVTAVATLTTLVVSDVNANANSIAVAYAPFGSSHGTWGAGVTSLSGYSNNPPTLDLVVGPVRSKTEKVGPLEEQTTYDGYSALAIRDKDTSRSVQSNIVNDFYLPEYPEADLWLEMVLRNASSGTRMVRGS
jgi:hypothetical protein